jgi:hypothetical protein
VVAGKFAGVIAGPEDQIIRLDDHDQFLIFFHGLFQIRCYNVMVEDDPRAHHPSSGDRTVHPTSFLRSRPLILDCHSGSRASFFGSDPAAPGGTKQMNIQSLLHSERPVVKL